MTPRKYDLGRRAEAAAATRAGIVEATMRVHGRRGISRATVREIADEAGVSAATVLRHFPEMADLVTACGRLTAELYPFPTEACLEGVRGRRARLRAAVHAVFGYYSADPDAWPMLDAERLAWPMVAAYLAADDDTRRALIVAALVPRVATRAALALAMALTTWKSLEALRAAGLDLDEATDLVTDQLLGAVRANT